MTQCVICMEEVKDKNCATLNCNHTFHATCLMKKTECDKQFGACMKTMCKIAKIKEQLI